jgi:hypothetical protein
MSGDRFIKVIEVKLSDPTAITFSEAVMAGFRVSEDRKALFVATYDWLCGPNCWGLHNDQAFTLNMPKIRAANRIIDAAEEAKAVIEKKRGESDDNKHKPLSELFPEGICIKISAADFEEHLRQVVAQPTRHERVLSIPAALSRAVLPILDAIEGASTTDPYEKKDEKPAEPAAG